MGTPIPPPIIVPPVPAGNQCPLCWGPGKEFGDIDTPSFVSVTVSGVNKNDDWVPALGEPFNSTRVLEQVVLNACQWTWVEATLGIEYRYGFGLTGLEIINENGFRVFLYLSSDPCELEFFNIGTLGFEGGSAIITLPGTF